MNEDYLLGLLADCGFKGKPNYKGELPLQFCCFHEHNYRTPSMGINLKKMKFGCLSCGRGGHLRILLYHFGIKLNGWQSFKDNKQFLERVDGIIDDFNLKEDELNNADESELKGFRYRHPYLLRRGFTPDIIMANGIGYDKDSASVTIPIYHQGRYHGVIRRATWDTDIRYSYPENLQKAAIIYKPNPVSIKDNDVEFIVEGSLDALRVAQFGYHVNAILGCMISTVQLREIAKSPRRKILALDNDAAGKAGTEHFFRLAKFCDVSVFNYPPGVKDIGEMSEGQFEKGVTNCIDRLDILALDW